MSYSSKERENQIATALGRCAASVKRAGNARWEFSLANGKPLGVSAHLFEDWLLLNAPMTDPIALGAWWDLLRLNASIPGLSKFVLMPESQSLFDCPEDVGLSMTPDCGRTRQSEDCRTLQNVHLRADIPLSEGEEPERNCRGGLEADLTTRVLETCAGLKAAFRSFRGEKGPDHQAPASAVSVEDRPGQRLDGLRRLCSDAGWQFIERSEGKLMIDLDVRGGFYQASVEQQEAGAEIAVEIVSSEALSEKSRQALSLLLLGTGALVRLARPSIVQMEDQISVRFEVRFTTTPTAIELAHAFSSLSVACAMSGREARALQDEAIARNYLAMFGPQTAGMQAAQPASWGSGD